ncbi:MAG: hypothetical protein JWM68_3441, partial [Verrucomicrobiales bacterium]|nr:hypothetical protein [Verrucomicrobiales bacterium]
VEPRQFLDPIRPTTVVVNTTTIINKTVNITNTKIVNNTVINEGPATATIEKASGRKVQPLVVRELRQKEEAVVIAKNHGSQSKKHKPTSEAPEVEREAKPESNREPGERKGDKLNERQESPARGSVPSVEEKPVMREKPEHNKAEKSHEKKPKQ